jgi:hypothetical protein
MGYAGGQYRSLIDRRIQNTVCAKKLLAVWYRSVLIGLLRATRLFPALRIKFKGELWSVSSEAGKLWHQGRLRYPARPAKDVALRDALLPMPCRRTSLRLAYKRLTSQVRSTNSSFGQVTVYPSCDAKKGLFGL